MINKTHPRPGNFLRASLLFCATFTIAQGETITQTVGNIDWNDLMWGTPAAAPTTGNDYVSATGVTGGDVFRISATGASSTFGGDSLTVVTGSRALMKNQSGAVATINGDLIINGGRFSFAPNGGPHVGTLDVVNLVITGTGSFIEASSSVTTFNIDGTLTGSGDLLIKAENGTNTKTISIASISEFTGALTVQATIRLDFGADHTFSNSLNQQSTAILNVDQALTFEFGKLLVNGEMVPAGNYTGEQISSLGTNFADGGGTLNVVVKDTDGDGLPDFYEDLIINFALGDGADAYGDVAGPNEAPGFVTDFDGDGLSDAEEYALETDPTNPDTDGDGLRDGAEIAGTNNQGVSTGFGPTDPNDPDSDKDGFSDGVEVRFDFNPNDSVIIPGTEVVMINGSFEDPIVSPNTDGASVSSGDVPGWSVVDNDFYVIGAFTFTDAVNAKPTPFGAQFASGDLRAPNPDIDSSTLSGGVDATMSMKQEINVSTLATEIDAGARTFLLDFAVYDDDPVDQGVVTINFLDASDVDLGRPSVYRSNNVNQWVSVRHEGYPPVGTRKVRITAEAVKIVAGTTSIRNVNFDNFSARLAHFDFDNDGMPDGWELANELNPDDDSDAAVSFDIDTLTNLQEFLLGTNPTLPDTDGDGIDDDVEVANGTDPLDPNSPGPSADLQVTDIITTRGANGQVTQVEVTVSGLDTNRTYRLVRGTDLASFPTIVDTRQPGGATESFFDVAPLPQETAPKAFYRVELQPLTP